VAQYDEFRKTALYGEGDYLGMLQKLFPRGKIWGVVDRILGEILQDIIPAGNYLQDTPPGEGINIIQDVVYPGTTSLSMWGRLLSCFAAELARVDMAAWRLWNESVSGVATTAELLPEWEKMYGLPNHCTITITDDQAARQRAVFVKQYRENVEASLTYYEDYARDLGFIVTIEHSEATLSPAVAGVAIAGSNRCAGRGANSLYTVTVSSGADLALLQCIFTDLKPAHVVFLWVDERT